MRKSKGNVSPKRGEIWIVNFNPTIGSEIRKTWPAVILQNNTGNYFSSVTIVAAISSRPDDALYPTEVLVEDPEGGLKETSVVLLNQIRTIDKKRLVKKIGALKPETLLRVNYALQISLGILDL